jgi:hypothetical protein
VANLCFLVIVREAQMCLSTKYMEGHSVTTDPDARIFVSKARYRCVQDTFGADVSAKAGDLDREPFNRCTSNPHLAGESGRKRAVVELQRATLRICHGFGSVLARRTNRRRRDAKEARSLAD